LALEGIVRAGGPDERANESELIGDARHFGHQFADLETGNPRGDWPEFAADLDRRIGLEIDHVLVGRTAVQVDVDDRLVRRRNPCGGFGPQETGQRQSANPHGPGRQELPAIDSVAMPQAIANKSKHGVIPAIQWRGGKRLGRARSRWAFA